MIAEENEIRYLAEMLDEAFPEETVRAEVENLLSEGDHWPEDFVRRAVNRICNSPTGKASWFDEKITRKYVEWMAGMYEALEMTHTSKETNLFKTVIGWWIEYSGDSFHRYVDFVDDDMFERTVRDLGLFTKDPELFAKYYEKLRNGMSFSKFQKEAAELKKKNAEREKKKMENFAPSEKGYDLVRIDSYRQFRDYFGGTKTGDGMSRSTGWCHANGKETYEIWTKKGKKNVFLVLFRDDWKRTKPSREAFDDSYGRSAIALLVDRTTGELLHATFRYNHVVEPEGRPVDDAADYPDLSEIAGFDVEKRVRELIGWDEEKAKAKNRCEFEAEYGDGKGNIDCSDGELTNLVGAPSGVDGSFDCNNNRLTSLEGGPSFALEHFDCCGNRLESLAGAPRTVGGDFGCTFNWLENLEGAPRTVGGNFHCEDNQLTSLAGAPRRVGGDFDCSENKLKNLEWFPKKIGGDFVADGNELTSLDGAPEVFKKSFSCSRNGLTGLEGGPRKVGGGFVCSENELKNLVGAPEKVGEDFDCSRNRLTSLEGCPAEVGLTFNCSRNRLTSLKGCPAEVGLTFDCSGNELTNLEGAPSSVGYGFYCRNNRLTSLKGAPSVVGNRLVVCQGNPGVSKEKLDAYMKYLKRPDPRLTDETGHYAPEKQ